MEDLEPLHPSPFLAGQLQEIDPGGQCTHVQFQVPCIRHRSLGPKPTLHVPDNRMLKTFPSVGSGTCSQSSAGTGNSLGDSIPAWSCTLVISPDQEHSISNSYVSGGPRPPQTTVHMSGNPLPAAQSDWPSHWTCTAMTPLMAVTVWPVNPSIGCGKGLDFPFDNWAVHPAPGSPWQTAMISVDPSVDTYMKMLSTPFSGQ